jgi:Fe-S oxidoreductase/nitrate reductase gamma subunit
MEEKLIPAREVFRHFSALQVALFYLLAAIAMGIFAYGLWLRIRKYRAGRPEQWRIDWARIARTAQIVATQVTLRKRNTLVGWAHTATFWAFVILFSGSLIIMVDHDILALVSPQLQFWKGRFYLWYSLALDLMGFALLVGLAVLAVRRWYGRPPQLDYVRADRAPEDYSRIGYIRDDNIFLWGLIWIGATGFLNEGIRICADRPPFEIWSPVGWHIANGLNALGISPAAANSAYVYFWWLHAVLALAFIAYIPYSKAIHILVDIVNLLVSDPMAGKKLPPIPEEATSSGYRSLSDFTWKELLNLDACTKCGRCHAACPAHASGGPLSPRDLILELREQADAAFGGGSWLHERQRHKSASDPAPLIPFDALWASAVGLGYIGNFHDLLKERGNAAQGEGKEADGSPLDEAETNTTQPIASDVLWACTSCLACVEACPVGIEHVPLVVQLRRNLVEAGAMEPNLQRVLERIGKTGNSFGESERNRGGWTKALPFKIKDAREEPVDMLWFVGDYASFDPGLRQITLAVARVLHKAGVDFGILYDGERNSGNDVRRIGEEGLFQMLVESNVAALAQAQFKEIITTDPHSYNTIKFEYPQFGGTYRIRHYTEVICELIEAGRLPVAAPLNAVATYHDPCHLSRYTGVVDAPRAILRALGLKLIEMRRNGANSFCCGAGGGRIWMANAGTDQRPSVQRIKEALEIPDLDYFVVACPKDAAMFRDAAASVERGRSVHVTDIIELVEAAMGSQEEPARP